MWYRFIKVVIEKSPATEFLSSLILQIHKKIVNYSLYVSCAESQISIKSPFNPNRRFLSQECSLTHYTNFCYVEYILLKNKRG